MFFTNLILLLSSQLSRKHISVAKYKHRCKFVSTVKSPITWPNIQRKAPLASCDSAFQKASDQSWQAHCSRRIQRISHQDWGKHSSREFLITFLNILCKCFTDFTELLLLSLWHFIYKALRKAVCFVTPWSMMFLSASPWEPSSSGEHKTYCFLQAQ